jgi:hypothetical protein
MNIIILPTLSRFFSDLDESRKEKVLSAFDNFAKSALNSAGPCYIPLSWIEKTWVC